MASDFKSIPHLDRISQNISWSRWYCEVESILLEPSTSEFSRKELKSFFLMFIYSSSSSSY